MDKVKTHFYLTNHALVFTCLQYKSFENTVGKGKICSLRAISPFSHSVFYPIGELPSIFIKFEIVVCKLFHFERV